MIHDRSRLETIEIEDVLKKAYLDYSMSVIVARALPDVRDGLKPSQRRILYSMHELNLMPGKGFRKCAKIAGDTSGNYHPHGEQVIYPTLVRMAQPWSLRYLLIDGQGNFGSQDGDPPAAMRYTEARLHKASVDLMEDLDKNTVDFKSNYDDTRTEPVVFPSKFPNLLVNGSSGIAVGMATNMPPHNVAEVCDAIVALIDNPEMEILEFVSDQIVKVIDKKIAEEKLEQYNKELAEAKKQLEITNKNKDKFFSIIAHDLKNPFMSILGTSKLLSDSIDNLTMKELTEISETMYSSSENLYKLLENLLSWSRIQLGKMQIAPKNIIVKPLVESVHNIFELTAKNKEIEFTCSIDENISVFADEDCLRTILRNLISNALKFTKPGGKISIEATEEKNGFIKFSVADSGVGMDKETLEKLFVITEKVTTRGTKGEAGTGLGLLLCKELVEKNNGTISVKSKINKGTAFCFTLPSKDK